MDGGFAEEEWAAPDMDGFPFGSAGGIFF